MKKLISAVLSAAVVMTSAASVIAAAPAKQADTPAPAAETKTEILHEVYEAEDAKLSGTRIADALDDYHGTGYVSRLKAGGSVSFDVDVPTAGKYGVKLRYSMYGGDDSDLNLYVNGEKVRKVNLAASLNEDTWAYQTEAVDLNAGKNTIEYKVDSDNTGEVNLDRIAMSWLYEAEDAQKLGNGKDNTDVHPGYSGTGFASGYNSVGYGRRFTVNVPEAGEYTLVMRYAAGQEDSSCRSVSMIVNGERTQVLLNTLRSWDLWFDHIGTVKLKAGSNTIDFIRQSDDNGAFNFDYITVKPVQWNYAGTVEKVDGNKTSQLTFTLDNCQVQVTSVDKNAVKVWLEPESRFERKYDSFAVIDDDLDAQKLEAVDKGNYYLIDAGEMDMKIQKSPFKITYLDKAGNVLVENENESMGWTNDGELRVNNVLPEDEAFWGLGEKLNSFNRRGEKVYMWAVDTWGAPPDDSVPSWEEGRYSMDTPHFVSSRGYSIFFDNNSRTMFDMGKTSNDRVTFGTFNPNPGGEMIYYFIYGGDKQDSIKKMTNTLVDLTGQSFMAPLWATGNIQCHYGYKQNDVIDVANKYREAGIPLDAIMIDIEWFKYLCTPTHWNNANFPDPDAMIKYLHDNNIRFGVINDPNITKADNGHDKVPNNSFMEADSKGYFVKDQTGNTKLVSWPWGGPSGLLDFFNPEARDWWGNLHEGIINQGVELFWLDMCEPSKYNADWLFYNKDGKSYGTFGEVKNALTIGHHESIYDQYLEQTGKRPFMLSRTATMGSRQYVSPWTGDINCGWESQNYQINHGISMSMSGYNYWGFDIGGFFGDASEEQFKRMVEMAAFMPINRFHYMTDGPKEAYTHNATEVSKKYIGLRYRLMPYTYSLTADNIIGIGIEENTKQNGTGTGVPICRPLVMNYPQDENTYNIDDQFMSGNNILVAPVVESKNFKEVYLPEGDWYDYEDGKTIYAGNQTMTYEAPMDLIPVFVKAGSIIPMQPFMQYVGEKPVDEITLDVYPTTGDGKFNFVMYEDDGETEAYKNGVYTTTAYDCEVTTGAKKDTIKFNIGERKGTYTEITDRDYMMQFHASDYANLTVTLDGKKLEKFDSLAALNAAAEGYCTDKSTGICYVKTHDTKKAMTVTLTGDAGTNSGIRLEAEEGTLKGCTADSETAGDTVTGYVSGFASGSSVTFQSFNLPEAGKYPVYVTYKTVDKDASVSLRSDEDYYKLSLDNSDEWTTALALIDMVEGENTITLTSGKDVKIDRIKVVPEIVKYYPNGTITAEAEEAELTDGATMSSKGVDYSGDGYAVLDTNGSTVTFDNVRVMTDGIYSVGIRYSEGPIDLEVTCGDFTETVSLPNVRVTLWSKETLNIPLKAGVNTITVKKVGGSKISLDCLEMSSDPYALAPGKELENAGFNTGNISGWKMENYDGKTGGYGVDSGDIFAGTHKFYFWDGSAIDKMLHQTVTGVENGRYIVRARIKVYNTNPEICQFNLSGYDGDAVTVTEIPYTSIWTTLQSDIVEIKDGQIDIGFRYKAPGGASIQIDDVTLWKVSDEAAPSKALLAEAIGRADKLNKADYTSESWDKYQMALILAEEVNKDKNATSDQIYGVLQYLESKEADLKPYVPETTLGDIDGKNGIDVNDLSALKALIMSHKAPAEEWDAKTLAVGDIDRSGDIDVNDLSALKAMILSQKA